MASQKGLSGLVVKVASRCNFNCSYCYMYSMGDESYRFQPKVMTNDLVHQLIEQAIQHCNRFKIKTFELILHGGEPLLAGKAFFENFDREARRLVDEAGVKLNIGVQTNGVLLNSDWCNLLNRLSISIGISLDGPAVWHDMNRRDHQQKGTHANVLAGLRIAQQRGCKVGVLCVMNAASDPVLIYHYFQQLGVRNIDFLWPDHHYESRPLQYVNRTPAPDYTPFGDWWIRLFDCWFADVKPKPKIRFLYQLMLMILGVDAGFESIGQAENRYLIVETDGGIEASDYLKACGNGFTKEGLNIMQHDLSETTDTALINMHRFSHRNLPPVCKRCLIRRVCGGGHIAHRFSAKNGFNNPSIYCFDLAKLLTHIQNVLVDHLSAETIKRARLSRTSYQEVLDAIIIN